ncbi:MAG: hypothetical protein IPL52_04280 [Flavobacteriales bacterium]|nr:hypothetical protein [Flavobacteriales bacterium]
MNKVVILLLLGFVLGPGAFAQKARLDSLLRVLKTLPEANADRMNTLIRLADSYASTSYSKSIECAHAAWRIADELDDDKGRAEAWMSECLTLYKLCEFAASDSVDRLARSVADPARTPRAYALAIQWGHCDGSADDTALIEQARREIPEAIEIFYQLGDSADLAWSLYGWGQSWIFNANADTLLKAMAMAKRNGETAIQLACMASLDNFEPYASDTAFQIHNEEAILHIADSVGDVAAALNAHMSLNYLFSNRANHVQALAHMIEALPLGRSARGSHRTCWP